MAATGTMCHTGNVYHRCPKNQRPGSDHRQIILVCIASKLSYILFYLGCTAKRVLSRSEKDWTYNTDAVEILVKTLLMAGLRSLLLVQEGCRSGDMSTTSYLHNVDYCFLSCFQVIFNISCTLLSVQSLSNSIFTLTIVVIICLIISAY